VRQLIEEASRFAQESEYFHTPLDADAGSA
jgi:hypothetical protein